MFNKLQKWRYFVTLIHSNIELSYRSGRMVRGNSLGTEGLEETPRCGVAEPIVQSSDAVLSTTFDLVYGIIMKLAEKYLKVNLVME